MTPITSAINKVFSKETYSIASANNLMQKVWTAVVDFFHQIAELITWSWEKFSTYIHAQRNISKQKVFSSQPVTELEKKLATYQNLPTNPAEFMQRAIELYQNFLEEKDQSLKQALKEELGDNISLDDLQLPSEQKPNQRSSFNAEFQNLEAASFPKIGAACVRAYVFSNINTQFDFLKIKSGYNYINVCDQLQELQKSYHQLGFHEQLLLLEQDHDLSKHQPSKEAIRIFQKIGELANQIYQNPEWRPEMQTVHALLFPDD